MAIYAKRLNGKQREWANRYERLTTFEPMHQEDLDEGKMTFEQFADANIRWFEDWYTDASLGITRDVPRKGWG